MAQEFGLYSNFPYVARSTVQQTISKRHSLVRAIVMMLLMTTFIGINAYRVAQLQLVQGQYHRERAENNRIRLVPVPAGRGIIYDRKGRLLVSNRLSRSVYLWPQEYSAEQWSELAAKLAPILDTSANDIIQKLEEVGYNSPLPVKIVSNLDRTSFVALAEKAGNTRGIEVRTESIRHYPHGTLAAHLIGYIGEASKAELLANPDYPMGMIVGQMGIERSANSDLEGVWGNRLIEVDNKGNEIKELGIKDPTPGKPVKLTIDIDLQKAAEKALGNRRGAAVAINAKTGEILAMASGPTFNPSLFTGKMTTAEWQRLQGASKPFLNRALEGYPPGSTFKTVTSTAAIQSGKYSPNSRVATYDAVTIGGITFNEHSGGYGVIGFRDALAYSSNTFFYQVGVKTGAEAISKWGRELGIGGSIDLKLLGIDGNHGQIPTPKQKEEMYDEPWHIADMVTMGIGHGLVLVTPLELSVMAATISNGGYRVQPHLLASQTNTETTKPVKTALKPETLNTVKEGLIDVVRKGTGRSLNDGTIPMSGGKTGTVELPGQADNAMYIGFAPAYNPEIAVAVAVEEGGYGSVGAAPIAKEMFTAYFQNKGK
ncbi:MAG: penicillin-binding protein 2 [Microcoleaceae cyanobacterium MO_207.B10]|nr:penicillin-binding protein 2 [Microcoleaceae cyanobacterium MO_207.B10]